MSQPAVEAAIGKLICDDAFRREFYEDPKAAVVGVGFQLTPVELSSVSKIRIESIEMLASHLDDRIRRAQEAVLEPSARSRRTRSQLKRS